MRKSPPVPGPRLLSRLPGALDANPVASLREGLTPHQVIFTAHAAGMDTNGLHYTWNFGDGSPVLSGAGRRIVTNAHGGGRFDVTLTVTNASQEIATVTRTNLIKAAPATIYVSLHGAHAAPFASWANASTDIVAACAGAVSGSTILVSNGTYNVTNQIVMPEGTTLTSVNGPESGRARRRPAVLSPRDLAAPYQHGGRTRHDQGRPAGFRELQRPDRRTAVRGSLARKLPAETDLALRGCGRKPRWESTAVDLDGNPRLVRGVVDMGCYEAPPLGCVFFLR